MIVYLETKAQFQQDVLSNRIEEKILDRFTQVLGKATSKSEIASWRNSLPYMDRILSDNSICSRMGIAIEFQIPQMGKRIDFILTGTNEDGKRSAVIVELKQWQTVEATSKDAIVRTFMGGTEREVSHPSYQAWSYAMLVEDFNETVRLDPIRLNPCAYLHNCDSESVINGAFYKQHTSAAPAFLKSDAAKLREFIKTHIKHGDDGETMFRIRDGKIRPSKGLADHLASLIQGKREFYMIDDQKLVYETALELAELSSPTNKNVLIVNGGPGTGKTVVAVNLLVELINREKLTQYVTKNSAPREVYKSKLSGTLKKSRIDNLFVGSGQFTETESDTFNALIVDEAHRLNQKSGLFSNLGENQVKEIIQAASFSIFFLDEDQRIHWKDIGRRSEIIHWASVVGAKVSELNLESQFRCNGSDGYLAWIDHTLRIRETANDTLEGIDYEFVVCDTAAELRDLIFERNKSSNKARIVAGYCWDWRSQKDPHTYDIEFPEQGFAARWNLKNDGSLWIISPNSVKEVGCIHTCQGLELDYVGVIIGEDLVVRGGEIQTDGGKRSSMDSSIKGYKGLLKTNPEAARTRADEIIKNTYRTLMTRGMKGCYIYSPDPETRAYLKQAALGAKQSLCTPEEATPPPFKVVPASLRSKAVNAVPILDLNLHNKNNDPNLYLDVCDWAELPEHLSAKPGYFVAQVKGEALNRKFPCDSWCLFREHRGGSIEGKAVLVRHTDIFDSDYIPQYTIRVPLGKEAHFKTEGHSTPIILTSDSNIPEIVPIIIKDETTCKLSIIGEIITIL